MRYALYFTPAASDGLTLAAARWLGRNAFNGSPLAQPAVAGFEPPALSALTADPRRYGFHATLKAPFELAGGRSEEGLRSFCRNYAAGLDGVTLPGLSVAALGSFVALIPSQPSDALQRFAFALVQAFEPFRAPLSDADLARRLKSPLTPAQHAYLQAYGYPYVGDAFRFHMTLTGSLPPERVAPVRKSLEAAHAAAITAEPVRLDRFALFRQNSRDSRFRLVDSYRLG